MHKRKRSTTLCFSPLLILLVVLNAGCASGGNTTEGMSWINGKGEQLAIRTFERNLTSKHPTLVVFLHGDKGGGRREISWEYDTVATFADSETISAVLLRPGYSDEFGNSSTGENGRDTYTAHNVDAVAEVIQKLKARYGAGRLILVGYSGGAAYAGVIIGRHPGLADAAVLLACPCNIPDWRERNEFRSWTRSLSPHTYADHVPNATQVIAVTGSNDHNTGAWLAKEYIEGLKQRGVPAKFRLAIGVSHDAAGNSEVFLDAVRELIRQRS